MAPKKYFVISSLWSLGVLCSMGAQKEVCQGVIQSPPPLRPVCVKAVRKRGLNNPAPHSMRAPPQFYEG